MKKLNPESSEIVSVKAMYESGMSQSKISAKTGLSHSAICLRLKTAGVSCRSRGAHRPEGFASVVPLSKEIRKHPDFVKKCINDLGIEIVKFQNWQLIKEEDADKIRRAAEISKRRLLGPEDPTINEVVSLYKEGMSGNQIAVKLGMTKSMVYTRLRFAETGVRLRGRDGGWMTLQSVADSLGRAEATIRGIVILNNIPHISQGMRLSIREDCFERVRDLAYKDYSLVEVNWKERGIAEWEMGWLGGIIDGEGHIQVFSSPDRRDVRSCVELCNTGIVVIEKSAQIIEKLGLEFSKFVSNTRDATHFKPLQKLRLKNMKDSWVFLKAIYPFLVLKKRDADILIKFCEIRAKNAGRLGGDITEEGKRLSAKMQECRKDLNRGLEAIAK